MSVIQDLTSVDGGGWAAGVCTRVFCFFSGGELDRWYRRLLDILGEK